MMLKSEVFSLVSCPKVTKIPVCTLFMTFAIINKAAVDSLAHIFVFFH